MDDERDREIARNVIGHWSLRREADDYHLETDIRLEPPIAVLPRHVIVTVQQAIDRRIGSECSGRLGQCDHSLRVKEWFSGRLETTRAQAENELNYRVIEHDGEFAIYEVFYDDDGKVIGHTESLVFPRAETLEDLIDEVRRYLEAADKPPLSY